jgi:PAS domain S-box-containing protein
MLPTIKRLLSLLLYLLVRTIIMRYLYLHIKFVLTLHLLLYLVSSSVENQDANDGPLEYYRPDTIGHNRINLSNVDHYNSFPTRDTQPMQSMIKHPSPNSTRIIKRPKVTKSVIDILLTQKAETDSLKRQWNQVILANSNDFIHVLSLKGIFLYCSNSTRDILGYEPSELLGTQISSLCHPSDMIPVMRELKESPSSKAPINLIYRIKRKHSGYMWIECHGKLDLEQGKGRKCIIMSGRERTIFNLPRKAIIDADTFVQANTDIKYGQFWSKLSIDGLFLYVSSTAQPAFEFPVQELNGLSIFQLVLEEENTDISNAIAKARDGQTVTIMHSLRSAENKTISVYSSFYPGNSSVTEKKPAFVLLQVRYQEKWLSDKRIEPQPSQMGILKAESDNMSEVSESTAQSDTDSSTSSEMDPIITNVMNALDAPAEENFFCELETLRPTSWQFELHQMRLTNKRLREKIERLKKRSSIQRQG